MQLGNYFAEKAVGIFNTIEASGHRKMVLDVRDQQSSEEK